MDIPKQRDPFSVMDNEIPIDINNIKACEHCGSLNVELDLATNKIVCRDCKSSPQPGAKKNLDSINAEAIDKDTKAMEEAMKRGVTFGVQQSQTDQTGT